MRTTLITLALLLAVCVGPDSPSHAAFVKAVVTELHQVRDADSVVIGIRFAVEIHDDATTETEFFSYTVKGAEFESLPAGAAARKSALIAIIKRETRQAYERWTAQRAARPKPALVRDPLSDLGAKEITTFTGEAPPLPSPSPSPTP